MSPSILKPYEYYLLKGERKLARSFYSLYLWRGAILLLASRSLLA